MCAVQKTFSEREQGASLGSPVPMGPGFIFLLLREAPKAGRGAQIVYTPPNKAVLALSSEHSPYWSKYPRVSHVFIHSRLHWLAGSLIRELQAGAFWIPGLAWTPSLADVFMFAIGGKPEVELRNAWRDLFGFNAVNQGTYVVSTPAIFAS